MTEYKTMNTIYTDNHAQQRQAEKVNQYSLMKYTLHRAMQHNFTIPSELHHELEYYKCLFWSVEYWLSRSTIGTTIRENKAFREIYQDCTRGQIIKLLHENKNYQLKLSFRSARKHWNLPAYVIIKIAATRPTLTIEGNKYVTVK